MAENYDIANASIDKREDVDDKPELSKFWLGEVAAAKKRDDSWHKRADKVIARYRDERELDRNANTERRANILWSNTETLKSALFQTLGNPDVRRRFPKKGDDDKAARQAALTLERGLSYCSDAYDSESQIEACIEDYLLPGRGTGWIVYEADVSEGYSEGGEGGDEGVTNGYDQYSKVRLDNSSTEPPVFKDVGPEISAQSVVIQHVFFKDFLTSAGRKWSDVWWCARGHDYSRDELTRYWPDHAKAIPLNVSVSGFEDSDRKGSKEEADTFKRARVWEVWDKSKKQRIYVAEEYDFVLEKTDDPYRLKDFFPTVEPIYGCKTTSSLTPIPEFTLYQDQAEELDILQTRLCRLTEALKRRGIYDATAEGADNQLSSLAHAGDNQFVPYRGMAALMEKGGLKNVFQTEDLAPMIVVIQGLSEREQALMQKIYDITGISDILRGSSDPNETATAQKIKGQFGSLRLQKRQKRIQCFIRDLYRLKAEIVAEHFTREQLVEMTGIDMPTKAEQMQANQMLQAIQQQQAQAQQMAQQGAGAVAAPQMPPPQVMQKLIATSKAVAWEDIESIIRSDQRRGYKVDIETDATNALDSETEKQQRIEFIAAMGTMLEQSLPMIAQAPPPAAAALVTLLKENAMFAAAAFKAGRTMEEAYEDAFTKLEDQAKAHANQPPKPSPEEQKLQADAKAKQLEFDFKAKDAEQNRQLETQKAQQTAQLQQQEMAHKAKLQEQELAHKMQLETFKAQQEAQIAAQKMDQEQQFHAMQFEADQQAAQQEASFKARGMEQDALFKEREFGHKQQVEGGKLEFEREKHGQQMAHEREKADREFSLKAFGEQPAAEGGQLNPINQMLQAMQTALQQQGTMLEVMAEHNAQMLQVMRAPRRAVRGTDGRLSHTELVMQ